MLGFLIGLVHRPGTLMHLSSKDLTTSTRDFRDDSDAETTLVERSENYRWCSLGEDTGMRRLEFGGFLCMDPNGTHACCHHPLPEPVVTVTK